MSQITLDSGLFYPEINREQVRVTCMTHGVSSTLAMDATKRLLTDPYIGASFYIIDSLTNKGARITYVGGGTFDVKISSRTGEALLDALTELVGDHAYLLDNIVIID